MAALDFADGAGALAGGRADALREGRSRPDERVADLVTSEVIPRLLLTCRANAHEPRPGRTHVDTLARLAIARDARAAQAHVGALRDSGVPIESLLNDLIGPAANRLGDFWNCDSADFADVAIGSSRLVQIARALGVEAERSLPLAAPRALIASPRDERHGLGALIVVQSFRAAGWRVTALPGADSESVIDEVRHEHYDMIGLSVGSPRGAEGLAALVARLRAASCNPRAMVALGGAVFACDPERARDLGADFVSVNAREALSRARALLPRAAAAAQ